jgi:hypothetical protein
MSDDTSGEISDMEEQSLSSGEDAPSPGDARRERFVGVFIGESMKGI